jgi:hypothetical protein
MRKLAFATALGSSLAAGPVFAGSVVYQTGFEAPTFTAGLPLVPQDGWAEPAPFLNPKAAIITTDQPFEGRQAVRVRGADLVPDSTNISFFTSGYYAAEGVYRKTVNFDVAGAGFPIVRVQAAVRVDGDREREHACHDYACSNFFSASVTGRAVSTTAGTAGIGELAISSDGVVRGYSGDDFVPGCASLPGQPAPPTCKASFLVTAPVSLGEYHVLAVNTDFVRRRSVWTADSLAAHSRSRAEPIRTSYCAAACSPMPVLIRSSSREQASRHTMTISRSPRENLSHLGIAKLKTPAKMPNDP